MGNTDTTWAISDGTAGNERQALALARALGIEPQVLRIGPRAPWRWLAPHLTLGGLDAIRTINGASLPRPLPALAIGCGRQSALLTRLLRERCNGRCFTVQILDPRIDPVHFDVVVAPRHDNLQASNVITTMGALNPVDREWLAAGRSRFRRLATLPVPRTAVLIGASNHAQQLDNAYFDRLMQKLAPWYEADGGSFLVTTSRRTPLAIRERLRDAFKRFPGEFWAGSADGENPYAGFLAWAERIAVTPDSVNLISEACATGNPVYTLAMRPITGKLAAFHGALLASGHLRRLGEISRLGQPPPLAETAAVAEIVHERWQRFRSSR
ncbi:MAG: mitochondrial fission ELM1 family protein [Rhodanobacteraceae bacterium]